MKPIIFNTQMVKAILDGRKTQTRRVVKPQPNKAWSGDPHIVDGRWADGECVSDLKVPYGQKGDRLWVRETFRVYRGTNSAQIYYKASEPHTGIQIDPSKVDTLKTYHPKWRPSIHIPRWASRITLEITDINVERIQDITDRGAKAEGIRIFDNTPGKMYSYNGALRDIFIDLWDSINYKRGHGWDINPWVWVISFKQI